MEKKKIFNSLFVSFYFFITLIFITQLYIFDKLPVSYFIGICVILLGIASLLAYIQVSEKISDRKKLIGKIIIGVLSILMIFGNVYIYKTNHVFNQISNEEKDKIEVSVVVMKDSSITAIQQLEEQQVGRISIGDTKFVDQSIVSLKKDVKGFDLLTYQSFIDFGDALYNGEVQAIVLDEAMRTMFEDNHPDFDEKTRVIESYTYDSESEINKVDVDNITRDPFIVYITGIDQRGKIGTRGRSDVNKIMTVNPNTHEILLIDIPRDYYVPQVCQANQLDKLTHTGIFGPDCTVETISNFFGVEINYYVRVNFSSLEKIVDAIGGVVVNSPYAFTTLHGKYPIQVGENHLNGAQALGFVRERYSLPHGDFDRIRNQTLVLSAIIDKVTSPEILKNYLEFLDSIKDSFQTNIGEDKINDLIKYQITDMAKWNITSYSVSGTGGTDWTPANGFNAYVNYPNMDTVNKAVEKINQVLNGEILSKEKN